MTELLQQPATIMALIACSALSAVALIGFSFRGIRIASRPPEDPVKRVFRNSALPILSQFMIRGVDLLVAIALLRLLGPEGNGEYALAVVIWLYVKTLTDFGLGLLVTREVAQSPERAGGLIGATTIFRWLVLFASIGPVLVYFGLQSFGAESNRVAFVAAMILLLSIVPSSFGEAVNSALNGQERMELAAWINIGVSTTRAPLAVALGATALGVSGVALAALVTSCLSAAAFAILWRRLDGEQMRWRLNRQTCRELIHEGWPLLVNALLVSLFFRIDVFIIDAVKGAAALGIYDAAYKLINLLTIIPAYATLAVFPLLAQRSGDLNALQSAYRRTAYLLLVIACGITVVTIAGAELAIQILAGNAYLPEAARLLQVLVLFAPLSFINGAFQYVLIAQHKQRRIVPVFLAALAFNVVANLLLIPVFGTIAAAANTVLTEVVILAALLVVSRDGPVPVLDRELLARVWRPLTAATIGIAVAIWLDLPSIALIVIAVLAFIVAGLILRVIGPEEQNILKRIINRQPKIGAERETTHA